MAGFTLPEKTFMVSFIAARIVGPFVRRWHDGFLEVWKGISERKAYTYIRFSGMQIGPELRKISKTNPRQREK